MTQVGRAAERLHDRRLHDYHTTFAEGRPRDDPEDRSRPLPEPRRTPRRPSRPRRAPSSASTTRTAPNPIAKLFEVQRDTAFTTHTYKHTTMGFLKDIEDMPNQYEYSKMFFERWYRPEYTTLIVAGDVDAEAVFRWWRSTGAAGSAALHGRRFRRSRRAQGARLRARPLAEPTAALGDGRLPRPRVLRDGEGLRGDGHALRPLLRRDVGPLQAARRAGAEGRPALRRQAG